MDRMCYHASQHVTQNVIFCINSLEGMVEHTSQQYMDRMCYHTSQHCSQIVKFCIHIMERM
eukprot:4360691-Ditylum_brightwellii.AAC.1